jgi:hypothetical protein
MHISTHHDRIWTAGCQDKEDYIYKKLSLLPATIKLVDSVTDDDLSNDTVITDNQFLENPDCKIVDIAPEFWHIYLCSVENFTVGTQITNNINCLMNRISGERMLLLYKLYERNLIEDNIISFNCLYHNINPTPNERLETFKDMHQAHMNDAKWNNAYQELCKLIPVTTEHTPDTAAMSSYTTIVVESYNHNNIVSFSEKIFRALQTPRPWLFYGSKGGVSILRDYGFDVLDDCVNHDYDLVEDLETRINLILDQCHYPEAWNYSRYLQAAKHNQQKLLEYQHQWPAKLEKILNNFS